MPIYEVKTKSGSEYEIDIEQGFWSRNGEQIERITRFRLALHPKILPWFDEEHTSWFDSTVPIVGHKMYLASTDTWAISSVVVSVDEKP